MQVIMDFLVVRRVNAMDITKVVRRLELLH